MADTDEVVRLRLLRAIRDLGWQQEWQQERSAGPNPPLTSAPGRIRTCDLRIRSPLLYPLSYRRRIKRSVVEPFGIRSVSRDGCP